MLKIKDLKKRLNDNQLRIFYVHQKYSSLPCVDITMLVERIIGSDIDLSGGSKQKLAKRDMDQYNSIETLDEARTVY